MTGLSIIAPCYNEEGNVAELARRIAGLQDQTDVPLELICVDDGSRDDTWRQIQQSRRQYDFVVPVRHPANAGIVAGWRSGLAACRYEHVVTIDADLQYRPSDILALADRMQKGDVDLVQGARVEEVQRSALRRFITAGFSFLLNWLFGMHLQDNKSGFILYRKEVMADIMQFSDPYLYFQHFVAVAAHGLGYRIAQVPVVFDPRHAGQSFITNPLRMSLRALRDLPRAVWDFRLHRRKRVN